ncbi:MAG: NADH-quinone oxidoreductase subunit M, partial [Candidatus Poribacteria bacterium]
RGLDPKNNFKRWMFLFSSFASGACLSWLIFSLFYLTTGDVQAPKFIETYKWIEAYSISYSVAIDGLSASIAMLISIIFPVLIGKEWDRSTGNYGVNSLFLLLQTSLYGAVFSQDLFLLFFFWAFSSVPLYFLISIWGGREKESAAFRFMVSSAISNALLFIALILIYYSADPHGFLMGELSGGKLIGKTVSISGMTIYVANFAFLLISVGFAIRAAMWPFNGWLNSVSEQAPASIFVAVCSVSIPVSMYLFIRFAYTLFPEITARLSHIIVIIGVMNFIIAGVCAATQKDLRRLLAYICTSGIGVVLVGIGVMTSPSVTGAIYDLLVQGLGIAGVGLFSGFIFERTGQIYFQKNNGEAAIGGVAYNAPIAATVVAVFVISILGLPGSGGFIGKSLLVIGTYSSHPVVAILMVFSAIIAAYYILNVYRVIFFGKEGVNTKNVKDLKNTEKLYLIALAGIILFLGVYPAPLLELIRISGLQLLPTLR